MENNTGRRAGTEQILKTAFAYWNKTLLYQIIYSLIYFIVFFIGYVYLFKYFGLWDEFAKYSDLVRTDLPAFNQKMEEIARLPQARNFGLGFFFLLAFINPLNVGLYRIYRKIDLGETLELNDLFAGYRGWDFFKFFGFYLFWIIIFGYANATIVLGIVWIFVTLFSVPLLYFRSVNTFEGIKLSTTGLTRKFTVVLTCVLVATLFSLSGLLLFGFGFLLTFPFWHAMIYTLYQNIYKEVE